MSGNQRRRPTVDDRGRGPVGGSTGAVTERETTHEYVRRVCGAKGRSDEPVLDDDEYVRYLTVGRNKVPVVRRRRSGDRFDEVL